MTYEFLQSLYDDLILITKGIVVKRYDLAKAGETAETAAAFELYYSCVNGNRYFSNFRTFDIDILQKYAVASVAYEWYVTPRKIPTEYRQAIIEEQSQRVINNYEEGNNYYRMLSGMPDTTDNDWLYVSGYDDIDESVPVHLLDNRSIAKLYARGIIDDLKDTRPDAKYLDFLGNNKIDFITARLAKPFEILKLGTPNNDRVIELFEREYYGARRYVMGTIYNRTILTNTDLYDPVIGMLMLTLAIRNTLVPDENSYLSFEEILDAILESYGMQKYFTKFPYIYKRRLVLALDKILSIKGTDGVILDVCQLFQGTNFTANRYYLLKTNKKNEDGTVQFTGVTDPVTGLPTMDSVADQNIEFLKTTIRERDMDFGDEYKHDYFTVTNNDYLWQLTEQEYKDLHDERFNLWMSKYIGIEVAYDITSVTFEVCYFLNLLLESPDNMSAMKIVNQYATNGGSDIFTTIVFMLALMAKKSGFDGNIIYEPEQIAEILRFDLSDIKDGLASIVKSYEELVDVDEGATLIPDVDTVALTEPNPVSNRFNMIETYVKNKELYDAILYEMHHTTDIRRYEALAKAKECMYISAMEEEHFTKTDGTAATTYYDMLTDLDPKLSSKLDTYDLERAATDVVYAEKMEKEMDDVLLYILNKLEEFFSADHLQYLFLNTPNIFVSVISKYLKTAINVFKASTVQLESINIIFNVGDNDPIRVIDQMDLHTISDIEDHVYIYDEVAFHKRLVIDDYVHVLDKGYPEIIVPREN